MYMMSELCITKSLLQDIFNDASALLYNATHKRTFFRSIKVLLPKTWAKKENYTIVSSLSSVVSHIRIGNDKNIVPGAVGSEECGREGLYMHLHADSFVLKTKDTLWGSHGKKASFKRRHA